MAVLARSLLSVALLSLLLSSGLVVIANVAAAAPSGGSLGQSAAAVSLSTTTTVRSSQTQTDTQTQTATETQTSTSFQTQTATQTLTVASTQTPTTATQTQISTTTQAQTVTATQTQVVTDTQIQTATQTQTDTVTGTNTAILITQTQTATATQTFGTATQIQTVTATQTKTATQTESATQTQTGATQTLTLTQTQTDTDTQTQEWTATQTQTNTQTQTTATTLTQTATKSAVVVRQGIQLIVNLPGRSTTATLSGCSVSPTRIAADGAVQTVTAEAGCAITVQLLSDASTRYVDSSGASTFTIATCPSGDCPNAVVRLSQEFHLVVNAEVKGLPTEHRLQGWFLAGSEIVITLSPIPGYKFEGWVSNSASIHISSPTKLSTALRIDSAGTVTAKFG